MNLLVGIDSCEHNDFDRLVRIKHRYLNQETLKVWESLTSEKEKLRMLTATWALKEAAYKAFSDATTFLKVDVLYQSGSKPSIFLEDKVLNDQYEISCSVTHTSTVTTAIVCAIKKW